MATIQYMTFNTGTTSSNSATISTSGVYYPTTTYVPQWGQQPAYVYGDQNNTFPAVVALPVDVSDNPIAWLKGRVQEMQDCWKEAA